MPKQKLHMIIGRVLWSLVVAGVVFLLMTAMQDRRQEVCSGVVINIEAIDGKVFIDEKAVRNMLAAEASGQLSGARLERFDLRRMEKRLLKEVWIEKADLFVDNAGVLHANIAERVPVARLFDLQGNSFYIDSTGKQLPLSLQDRADLPVFTNVPALNKNNKAFYDTTMAEVISMANVIRRDEFWNAQAAQIDLVGNGRYELYPAVGFHKIELGDAQNITSKLNRLKVFYREVMANKPITTYSLLSVAFTNQVVAVKGDGQVPGVDPTKAIEVFNQLVSKNKSEVNANAVESEKDRGRIMPEYNQAPSQTKTEAMLPKMQVAPTNENIVKPDTMNQRPRALMPVKTTNN